MTDSSQAGSAAREGNRGAGGRRLAAQRGVLANDGFRNLFWAMLTSSMGDWVGVVAIIALTEQVLGGATAVAFGISVVMVARIVPTMLLGPVAGVFVDRWDRRRTMIVADIGRGVVMALLAFAGDLSALILATLVIEVFSTLFIPAKDSVLPNLVDEDQLVYANQLSLGATYGTFPLGGVLLAVLVWFATTFVTGSAFLQERPVALPIWVNAATFFVSAVCISRIGRLPDQQAGRPTEPDKSAWQELKEGVRFIGDHPLVRSLVFGVMAAFVAAGGVIAVGELFAGIVNAGEIGFGVLIAAVGFGLFAGMAWTGVVARRVATERLFAPGIGVAGVALVAAALMPRLDATTIPAFVMGAGAGTSFLSAYTLLQEHTDDAIRGRTFAAFNTGVRMALFVSLVLAPALVGVIGLEGANTQGPVPYMIGGVRITLIASGLLAVAGAVWSGRSIHDVLAPRGKLNLGVFGADGREGLLVTFPDTDATAVATLTDRLARRLRDTGREVVASGPQVSGGAELGDRIRAMLLDSNEPPVGHRAEALLHAAARAQHADKVIRPALQRGAVVLTSHYPDSSALDQSTGPEPSQAELEELNRWATQGLAPDVVVVLASDQDTDIEGTADLPGAEPPPAEHQQPANHNLAANISPPPAASATSQHLILDISLSEEALAEQLYQKLLEHLDGELDGGEPAEF